MNECYSKLQPTLPHLGHQHLHLPLHLLHQPALQCHLEWLGQQVQAQGQGPPLGHPLPRPLPLVAAAAAQDQRAQQLLEEQMLGLVPAAVAALDLASNAMTKVQYSAGL